MSGFGRAVDIASAGENFTQGASRGAFVEADAEVNDFGGDELRGIGAGDVASVLFDTGAAIVAGRGGGRHQEIVTDFKGGVTNRGGVAVVERADFGTEQVIGYG